VQAQNREGDASLTSLVADILGDVGMLVRKELELARVELRSDLSSFKTPAVLLVAGAFLAAAGLIVGVLAGGLVIAFVRMWPPWAGYALAGGFLLVVGGILLAVALARLRAANLYPEKTAESLQENYQWLTNRKPSTRTS